MFSEVFHCYFCAVFVQTWQCEWNLPFGCWFRVGVLGEPFCLFFHKVMMIKNAFLLDLRSVGRVKDMNFAVISP